MHPRNIGGRLRDPQIVAVTIWVWLDDENGMWLEVPKTTGKQFADAARAQGVQDAFAYVEQTPEGYVLRLGDDDPNSVAEEEEEEDGAYEDADEEEEEEADEEEEEEEVDEEEEEEEEEEEVPAPPPLPREARATAAPANGGARPMNPRQLRAQDSDTATSLAWAIGISLACGSILALAMCSEGCGGAPFESGDVTLTSGDDSANSSSKSDAQALEAQTSADASTTLADAAPDAAATIEDVAAATEEKLHEADASEAAAAVDAPACFTPTTGYAPSYCATMGADTLPQHLVRVFHAGGQLTCLWDVMPASCACDYSCGCILPKLGPACVWQCAMNTGGAIAVYCKGDGPP